MSPARGTPASNLIYQHLSFRKPQADRGGLSQPEEETNLKICLKNNNNKTLKGCFLRPGAGQESCAVSDGLAGWDKSQAFLGRSVQLGKGL